MSDRTRRFRWTALSFLILAAGCTLEPPTPGGFESPLHVGYALLGEDAGITLTADAESFEPGAPMTLVLENDAGEPVGFNLCGHALERRAGESWELLHSGNVCTLQLNALESGEAFEYQTALPEGLEPGEYRARAGLHLLDSDERRDQVSNTFRVEG